MISSFGGIPSHARDNQRGFLSSIMAWLQGSGDTGGEREFEGYRVWTRENLESLNLALPDTCTTALTELIRCDDSTTTFQAPGMHSWLGAQNVTDSVCDAGCGEDLRSWFDSVSRAYNGYTISGAVPMLLGGRIWQGYNETCLKDVGSGRYCGGKSHSQ